MDKITIKLMKYFLSTISIVILISFILSSTFLSKFYINDQYSHLKEEANNIYKSLKSDVPTDDISLEGYVSNAVLIRDDSTIIIGNNRMGIMPFLRMVDFHTLQEKGHYSTAMNQEFLYYRLKTDIGDIITLQNNKYSSNYINIVYLVLILVFLLALVISIPLTLYFGKKFTRPIIKLQKASLEIAKGNNNVTIAVNTNDEIEELSKCLNYMAQSIEKKNELQRDFIANVSHDFKTPLSIIRNYSEAINDGLIQGEDIKNYSSEIIGEVDRLNSLVMDILELSKLQGGNPYDLKKTYFDLGDFLSTCSSSFKSFAKEKNLEVIITSINADINADYNYLYRVLYNLIDNAIKFSNSNSTVLINSSLTDIGIKVSVKDFGIGIEKEKQEDIWNKYYKHSKRGGMGLGLVICREILDLHGFQYGVTSSPEEGTEFYFYVPKESIKT